MRSTILITKERIATRIARLGDEIMREMKLRNIEQFDMLWLAEGAFVFAADLCRAINMPMRIFSLRVSSYGDSKQTSGKALYDNCDFSKHVGRHVLLVDDVLDTGITAKAVLEDLKNAGVASVSLCVLLDKKIPNRDATVCADFSGFEIENSYVIGYGLDCAQLYRNLSDVQILEDGDE